MNLITNLIVLVSCFFKNGPSVPMPPHFSADGGVAIWYSALDGQGSKKILKTDLIDRGYIPVQIAIHNATEHTFILSPEHISIPTASGSHVAMSITKRAIPRAIGYKIASFLFWPFMVPSTIDSVRTYSKHRQLKKHFRAHSVKKENIPPFTTVHRILFVPSEQYVKDFTISLENKCNGEIKTFWS